jgi:beta-lactamase class A
MNSFFAYKLSFPYFISIIIFSILSTYFVTDFFVSKKKETEKELLANNSCDPKVKRLDGYNYIRPLLFVDKDCNVAYLNSVNESINTVIEKCKKEGTLNSASVYLKDFSTDEIISINENEKYKPGSLMKVPELITLLLMNEKNPGFLDK